jgi:hypothetical protein
MEATASTQISEIRLDYPEASDLHLWLKLGACRLNLNTGVGEPWVRGIYDGAESGIKPNVQQQGGTATIAQEWKGINFPGVLSRAPSFNLEVSKAKPFMLTLDGGASESTLQLGGLPIQRLLVNHGAGRLRLEFAEPNPLEMSLLRISSGASDMEVRGLANANCAELSLEGGASRYVLDFSGNLKRDMHAQVKVGAAAVEVYVPRETAIKVIHDSFLGGVEVADGFMHRDGAFWNQAALAGQKPLLNLKVTLALGSLKVVNT